MDSGSLAHQMDDPFLWIQKILSSSEPRPESACFHLPDRNFTFWILQFKVLFLLLWGHMVLAYVGHPRSIVYGYDSGPARPHVSQPGHPPGPDSGPFRNGFGKFSVILSEFINGPVSIVENYSSSGGFFATPNANGSMFVPTVL